MHKKVKRRMRNKCVLISLDYYDTIHIFADKQLFTFKIYIL